jgi:hypothetical protein
MKGGTTKGKIDLQVLGETKIFGQVSDLWRYYFPPNNKKMQEAIYLFRKCDQILFFL